MAGEVRLFEERRLFLILTDRRGAYSKGALMSGKALIRGFTVLNKVPRSTSTLLGTKMRTRTPSNPPLSQEVPFPVFPLPSDKLPFGRGKGKLGYAVFSVNGKMAMQGQRSETQLNVE